MRFYDPAKIELAVEQDEVLRGIRDRNGFRALILFLGVQMFTGAALMFVPFREQGGRYLFWFSIGGTLLVSLVEWRYGIRRAAKEQIDRQLKRKREILHEGN